MAWNDIEGEELCRRDMVCHGVVAWAELGRFEIQIGKNPKPDMKIYSDGNPLDLKTGDKVTVIVRK